MSYPFIWKDLCICWSVDLEVNEKRTLADGNTLSLVKEGEEWLLKYGARKIIPVIELKSILYCLNSTSEISI